MDDADATGRESGGGISPALFVFAAAGVCLGLSDVWRVPSLLLKYDSLWFPLVYLAAVVLVGMPLLVAELALARLGHSHPSTNFGFLVKDTKGGGLWQYAGIVVLITVILILFYTTVVAGLMMAYSARAAVGEFHEISPGVARLMFQSLITDPERLLGWHTLFVLALGWVAGRGLEEGLGRVSRGLVLAIFAIAAALVGLAFYRYGASGLAGLHWTVHGSQLSVPMVLDAVTQAFFTLGVCMGAMMILGTHLSPRARLGPLVLGVVGLDTLFVVLACVAVLPVLLDQKVDTEGISFAMETVPMALSGSLAGRWCLTAFYVLLFMLVATTALVLMEFLVCWIGEKTGRSRSSAAHLAAVVVWVGGLLALLSFSAFSFNFEFVGKEKHFGLFDVMDILSARILLPVIGLLMTVFVGWRIDRDTFAAATGWGHAAVVLHVLKRYLVPVAVAAVFAALVFGRMLYRV
ncbi:MAG: sodium-dependent transporter [Arenicellales bacterium]